jgi:hypothetical protein
MKGTDRFLVAIVTVLLVSYWPLPSTGHISPKPTPSRLLTWRTSPNSRVVIDQNFDPNRDGFFHKGGLLTQAYRNE